KIPIYEPGLKALVVKNKSKNRLFFSTKLEDSLNTSDFVFIAVGTPMGEDGSADLQYVESVARHIGQLLNKALIVVDKSTVPIGTAESVRTIIQHELDQRQVDFDFDVVSNPEFLKEGAAIQDFMKPDRIVIGANSTQSLEKMKALYMPFFKTHDRFVSMDIRSAEMTKYAANAMLATKISFMNEMANICEHVGADVNSVRLGIGSDSRIGYSFIYPGCGYGGSCFPKDVNALVHIAEEAGYETQLLKSVESVNAKQKDKLSEKLINYFGKQNLNGLKVGIWGLAFKPETDDMREAPAITTIKNLVDFGVKFKVYDPKAMHEAQQVYLKDYAASIDYCETKYDATKDIDALLLHTEWNEFRSPDFDILKQNMKQHVFIDGRNQFDPKQMKDLGFTYFCIGR
ncbi:MAG: UDP-glucose dehydrogenase family protein, partial [Flavobacteriales bacterium]